MKKRDSLVKLNMKKRHSDIVLRSMLYSLVQHGKLETTTARAKVLKRYADREIGYCLRNGENLQAGQLESRTGNRDSAEKIIAYTEFLISKGIGGGSATSIVKTRFRDGDNAEMAEVVLAEFDEYQKLLDSKKPKKPRRKKPAKAESTEKKEAKKKPTEKEEPETGEPKGAEPEQKRREGILNRLGGRLLGRKVQNPQAGGPQGRSTARSGI